MSTRKQRREIERRIAKSNADIRKLDAEFELKNNKKVMQELLLSDLIDAAIKSYNKDGDKKVRVINHGDEVDIIGGLEDAYPQGQQPEFHIKLEKREATS